MSPTTAAPRKRKRKKKSFGWQAWWPLPLALVLTPFAVRGASLLALAGPGALRAAFPFAALLPGLGDWVMWAQLPLYGLILALFARKGKVAVGFLAVAAIHGAALAAALLLRS